MFLLHCVWEALNSSTSLSFCCCCTYLWMYNTFILNTDTNSCDKELKNLRERLFSSLTPPPPPRTPPKKQKIITWDRHKHLQDTYPDIGACVCVCMCMHSCVGLGVCACVCVWSCMHWILTICTFSNFHSIKRMNPLVSDETGSPPPPTPNPFLIFNPPPPPPLFFLNTILQNEISLYPLWFHEI